MKGRITDQWVVPGGTIKRQSNQPGYWAKRKNARWPWVGRWLWFGNDFDGAVSWLSNREIDHNLDFQKCSQ